MAHYEILDRFQSSVLVTIPFVPSLHMERRRRSYAGVNDCTHELTQGTRMTELHSSKPRSLVVHRSNDYSPGRRYAMGACANLK
ncbi:hypothetical protein M404DRAFT_999730 [Pisolithus tinctorius Marx 270]|uniref:Uncharacterized protein n=1 Tax=Pisolithus tinctorius Marx 270 TaxID=870435 RepID=A0A0C3PCW1_PISTI|nr:hypothetical protein M404DRAFT_999730 [Pisolithus tinctorius Marx 270]